MPLAAGKTMNWQYILEAKKEIDKWKAEGPSFLTNVANVVLTPAQELVNRLIPESVQTAISKAIFACLEGLNSAVQKITDRDEIRRKVAVALEETGDELQAADVVARECWKWHVRYAVAEGGTTGATGYWGIAADIPALFGIALRLIQEIGTCYGYDVTKPEEREYALHVLQTASAADVKVKAAFLVQLKELEQVLLEVSWRQLAEDIGRGRVGQKAIVLVIKDIADRLGIQLTEKKALQMIPVFGAVVGASFNATFINDVGRAAFMCYRERRIAEIERQIMGLPPSSRPPLEQFSVPPQRALAAGREFDGGQVPTIEPEDDILDSGV